MRGFCDGTNVCLKELWYKEIFYCFFTYKDMVRTTLPITNSTTQFCQCKSNPRSWPTCVSSHILYKTNWKTMVRRSKTSKNVISMTQNKGVRRMKQKTVTTWHYYIRRFCVWPALSLYHQLRVYTRSIAGWQIIASRSDLNL